MLYYRKNRVKKLAGLLNESIDRPEGYKELSGWLGKILSPSDQLKLSKLTYNEDFEAAAEFLKDIDPDALDLWSEEELAEYLAQETYDTKEDLEELERGDDEAPPGFDEEEPLGYLGPFKEQNLKKEASLYDLKKHDEVVSLAQKYANMIVKELDIEEPGDKEVVFDDLYNMLKNYLPDVVKEQKWSDDSPEARWPSREDYEEEITQIKSEEESEDVIKKYNSYFKKAGFGPYQIDFSDVDPKAIEAMGEALKKLYE